MKNSNSQLKVPEPAEQNPFSWRSEFYAWFAVFLLIMAFSLSMVDRMILTLLVGPIKTDFGLSDTEISLLHGLAFTLLYVIAGIPLGRLTDRYSRRMIAGFSVFFWSIATCLCGITNNFTQLFISRVFVGVGEAGLSPAATSLISDYFPVSKLSRPIAYFSIGGSLGAGLAFIFGGAVADMVVEIGNVSIPFIGEIRSWQLAFFIVGLPGLLFAASFIFVKEPARAGETKSESEPKSIPIPEVLKLLSDKAGFLTAHFFAAAMSALVVLSIHAWMPTFLMRSII
ncbi:MAG: MFS transporter [Paraglaciecola sp.]|nr:MFS transporter [Paraglaciecola sp.]